MGALRRMALDHGLVSQKSVEKFHAAFLDSVRKHGRIHELGAMLGYVRRTGRVFTDVDLAPKILNKISIRPHAVKGRSEVLKIMDRFEAEKSKKSMRRENDDTD
jgi:heterodisulfide reductase subunit C